jgi:hypothetical protein
MRRLSVSGVQHAGSVGKLARSARKEDEERDEKGSQKLIERLDRPHQRLFQQHRSNSVVPARVNARNKPVLASLQ